MKMRTLLLCAAPLVVATITQAQKMSIASTMVPAVAPAVVPRAEVVPQLTVMRAAPVAGGIELPAPGVTAGPPPTIGEGKREPTPEEAAAAAFRRPHLEGAKLAKAVDRVTRELTWHDSLADASRVARAAQKPIVWIQALGTLKGVL